MIEPDAGHSTVDSHRYGLSLFLLATRRLNSAGVHFFTGNKAVSIEAGRIREGRRSSGLSRKDGFDLLADPGLVDILGEGQLLDQQVLGGVEHFSLTV